MRHSESTVETVTKSTPSPAQRARPQRTSRGLGRRLLQVLVVLALYFVLEVVTKLVAFIQFIIVAWRGRPEPRLQRAGASLARFMHTMWLYFTFASDEPPWPFAPWPDGAVELERGNGHKLP